MDKKTNDSASTYVEKIRAGEITINDVPEQEQTLEFKTLYYGLQIIIDGLSFKDLPEEMQTEEFLNLIKAAYETQVREHTISIDDVPKAFLTKRLLTTMQPHDKQSISIKAQNYQVMNESESIPKSPVNEDMEVYNEFKTDASHEASIKPSTKH